MRGREVFMASLEAHGVTAIFGNPGTTENPLLDSLVEHPGISYYVALHEGVAVGAAGFYAQASGKVGVANLHVAPGLGNAIGMLYGALKAGSPLVVTAGQQDTRMRLRDPILGHDLVAMAAPVTKWSVEARSADELGPILRRAFKMAQEPPAGPVFVALPIDVMEQETAVAATTAGVLHDRPTPDAAAIDKLARLLAASSNPGIVAGDDVAADGAGAALAALAERLGAGVYVESLRARQPLPFDHANFCGRLPYAGGDIARLLAPHDVVVLIGGRFFEEVWFDDTPWLAPETLVVQIEAAPQRLAHNLSLDLGVVGAATPVLAALAPALDAVWSDATAARAAARQGELTARRAGEQQALDRQLAERADASPLSALQACATVARNLPPRAILVDESITAYGDVMRAFALGHSDDYFAGRGGGIGQGLAGALGVAVACPDRPVVALSGDGSAMYSIQALWSAAHHGLDIVFVILSNREYRVLKHNLDTYRARFGIVTDKPYPHMNLTEPVLGFVEMAHAMGLPARQVSSAADLAAALDEAGRADGPWLIDVLIGGKED
ncbi:MAG: thiamine pyrophosphate-binding protein [Gammaproteobacteria bacterium]